MLWYFSQFPQDTLHATMLSTCTSLITWIILHIVMCWVSATPSLKALSMLEGSLDTEDSMEKWCDLIIISPKAENISYSEKRAQFVYSGDSLPSEDKMKFVLSPCLVFIAGQNSNISQLIGAAKGMQLKKPVAMMVAYKMKGLSIDKGLSAIDAPFPLLLRDENGEFE